MKVTYTDQQADFLRILSILIITVYLVAIFGKWAFIAFGVFAFIFFAAWAYLSFLNPEDIIARRDNFEEPPFDSAYDEYRQTGVDRRKAKEAKPDNPGQLCQPCEFTGVVTDAERNSFDWPEFKATKPATK